MIASPVLKSVGITLAQANNASFVWRKLSAHPSVIKLAETSDVDDMRAALGDTLAKEDPTEDDRTAVYMLASALLLVSSTWAPRIAEIQCADPPMWLEGLLDIGGKGGSHTVGYDLIVPPVSESVADQEPTTTNTTGIIT